MRYDFPHPHRYLPFRVTCIAAGMALVASATVAAIIPDSQLQRAMRKQNRLIAEAPYDATLWNDLGNLLMLDGRATEAEEAYAQSLELDPDLVTARYNLALLYQQTGRPGRSKRALLRILRNHPEHAWSRYYLGVAHSETGRRKAAIRQFALAMRLEPDLTDPRINPHVLDNGLLADAALHAYADPAGARLAPRLYENRERVVRSMVQPNKIEAALSAPVAEAPPEAVEAQPDPETRHKPRPAKKKKDRKRDRDGDGG